MFIIAIFLIKNSSCSNLQICEEKSYKPGHCQLKSAELENFTFNFQESEYWEITGTEISIQTKTDFIFKSPQKTTIKLSLFGSEIRAKDLSLDLGLDDSKFFLKSSIIATDATETNQKGIVDSKTGFCFAGCEEQANSYGFSILPYEIEKFEEGDSEKLKTDNFKGTGIDTSPEFLGGGRIYIRASELTIEDPKSGKRSRISSNGAKFETLPKIEKEEAKIKSCGTGGVIFAVFSRVKLAKLSKNTSDQKLPKIFQTNGCEPNSALTIPTGSAGRIYFKILEQEADETIISELETTGFTSTIDEKLGSASAGTIWLKDTKNSFFITNSNRKEVQDGLIFRQTTYIRAAELRGRVTSVTADGSLKLDLQFDQAVSELELPSSLIISNQAQFSFSYLTEDQTKETCKILVPVISSFAGHILLNFNVKFETSQSFALAGKTVFELAAGTAASIKVPRFCWMILR